MATAKTTKVLQLTYLTSEDETSRISITNMNEDLTQDVVFQAMQDISDADVFEKDGVKVYATPKSANYIERTVTNLYEGAQA